MMSQWLKQGKLILLSGLLAVPLLGCNMNGDENAGQNRNNNNGMEEVGFENNGNNNNGLKNNNGNDGTNGPLTDMADDNNGANNGNNLGNGNNNGNNNNGNRFDVADQVADRVSQLEGIRRANVIVTDNNAYVAAVLEGNNTGNNGGNGAGGAGGTNGNNGGNGAGGDNGANGQITQNMKQKISRQVKASDPDINNVYVSANPDFVDRMNNWADDIGEGDPVQGFAEEFNNVIQRIFPNRAD